MNPAEPIERIQCQWCQSMNAKTALDLPRLRSAARYSQSGERIGLARSAAHPRHDRDSLQLQHLPGGRRNRAGGRDQPGRGRFDLLRASRDAVEGRRVPLTVLPLSGGIKRAFAGMPFIISVATGPGRIAFSRDATGELVVLPLHPGMELDVREHAFLLCSHQINYSFVRVKGLDQHFVRRPGHVHGPLRHHQHSGPADPARLRQRVRAQAGRARASWWSRARFCTRIPVGDHGSGISDDWARDSSAART